MVKRKGLPEWGEYVLVIVNRITPYAAWCKLQEYPDIEGMIHVSEVSGKWVHDIRDFVKINKQYVTKVVKIDYQKNSVNLSLKRVSERDEKEKINSFKKEQRAEKMLEHAAIELGKTLDQAYDEVGFLLQEKFGELSVAFEEARKSKETLVKVGIPNEWIEAMSKIAEASFQEKEYIIKSDLELKSYSDNGIEEIKNILAGIEKIGAIVKYISAPKYRVEIKGKDAKTLEKKLVECLKSSVERIEKTGGEGSYILLKD